MEGIGSHSWTNVNVFLHLARYIFIRCKSNGQKHDRLQYESIHTDDFFAFLVVVFILQVQC